MPAGGSGLHPRLADIARRRDAAAHAGGRRSDTAGSCSVILPSSTSSSSPASTSSAAATRPTPRRCSSRCIPGTSARRRADRSRRSTSMAEGAEHHRRARCWHSTRRRFAAWARAGGFEVYVQDRADADPQKLYQNRAAVHRRAAQAAGAHRHQHVLSPDVAAASCRRRSRKGRRARRAHERRVRRAAEHDGRAVRQRLQQVRPHLSRAAAGRRRVPRRSRKTSAMCTSAPREAT